MSGGVQDASELSETWGSNIFPGPMSRRSRFEQMYVFTVTNVYILFHIYNLYLHI